MNPLSSYHTACAQMPTPNLGLRMRHQIGWMHLMRLVMT